MLTRRRDYIRLTFRTRGKMKLPVFMEAAGPPMKADGNGDGGGDDSGNDADSEGKDGVPGCDRHNRQVR